MIIQRLDSLASALAQQHSGDMPVEAVAALVLTIAQPVAGTETLPLAQALDRVLVAALPSPVDVPPHDNAAMDGYAFDGSQLQPGRPLALRCVGTVLAGAVWPSPIAAGETLRIMTGAAMPPGLDTVVPGERVTVQADATVLLPADAVRRGANCRHAGEDLRQGQTALPQGQRLGPAALGLAASLGLATLEVHRPVRVACFSTGNELLAPGEPPRPGAIYDSNRFSVGALLRRLGAEVLDFGAVPDDPVELRATFQAAAAQADMVLSSGGASAGDADHTRQLLQALCHDSGGVAFWQVAMRPGRPLVLGQLGLGAASASGARPALLFGLPGNPVAAMVSCLLFVRPALLRMMGCHDTRPPPMLRARLGHAIPSKRPGRAEYLRGTVDRGSDGWPVATTTGQQGSGILRSMVEAQGLIVLPAAQGPLQAGDAVDVMLFDGLI